MPDLARRLPARLRPFAAAALLLGAALGVGVPALAAQDAPPPPPELEGLDTFIEEGMAEWGIPGLAVAVVHRDEVVWARGFGVRRLGEPEPVDASTLFGVASVSKAFTAAALGILVDEGLVSWDDRVVDHLPDFRLHDPLATREATIRDLLAHRVGVGRMTGNRIRWLPSRDREELVYRMRYLELEQPFRNGYVYSNVMYMVAGQVVEAVTGLTWDAFVAERIFEPLGMERSNTSVTAIGPGENAAWPHQEIEGEVVEIERRNFDNVGSSASINTSVDEITAWMRLHLGTPGEVDGVALLQPGTVREMHRAQNRIPDSGLTGGLASYGLGWRLSHYEGVRQSQHGGATDGMNTTLVLLPEMELGVIVTTNTFNSFMNAVANRVLDRYLGIEDRPWDQQVRQSYLASYDRAMQRREAIEAERQEGTETSVPLEAFTGTYEDDLYAEARVRLEDGGLVLEFWGDEGEVLDLEHWHHDTFRAVYRNRAQREKFVWFSRGEDGGIERLNVRWTLRPVLLQVGIYPTNYFRIAEFVRTADGDR